MNSKGTISSVGLATEVAPCQQCGSTSHIGANLCLKCLLYRGLGEDTYDNETLNSVLDEVDVRDADWRLGNYQILEEIGRGGMGVIYRARQRHSRRIVALKRILAHHADSHDTLVRFRREAEAAASLDHPNILPIYEVSEAEDGLPFFSMKFAAGGSLLENRLALDSDTRRAIELMAKVSRGVEYAHSRNILHRDLKPGNILLDARGEPMVSDFGLAKWLDESSDLTRTLTIFGTPGYIAPEQAHGPASSLKPTADVYSLGAILFDLLANRPPFLGEHALSVIQQAAEKPAPKLRSIVPKMDRDLETICARCLERDANARYQSAGQLTDDLNRWLDGRPILSRPVSPAVRVWRWARRNPKLASSVTGSVLGGAAIMIFALLTVGPNARFQPLPRVSGKSVAVLPFQNLSEEKQDAFVATGVQEEILNDLAKVADLKVISRTSVMQYAVSKPRNLREIARALRVANIVEGTVQRVGDRVRVSAQLIDATNDEHLWGEHYDRRITDVFAIESDLAEQIVAKLKAKLSPEERNAIQEQPTGDLAAYESYVRAKALIETTAFSARGNEGLVEAAALLEQAVHRDPKFLLAYVELAGVEDQIYFTGVDHTPARLTLAENAIDRILELRPDAGVAHLALAQHFYFGYKDHDRARTEIDRAIQGLPNNPIALLLAGFIDRRQGRWQESIEKMQRALEVDPCNIYVLQQLTQSFAKVRRYSDMLVTLDRALAISPDDSSMKVYRAEGLYRWHADLKSFHAEVERVLKQSPQSAQTISEQWLELALDERDAAWAQQAIAALPVNGYHHENFRYPRSWCEGLVERVRGNTAAARRAFTRARQDVEEIIRKQSPNAEELSVLGMIDAALGRKQDALREGQLAVQQLPVTKDAINGPLAIDNLAIIYAWTGEEHLALEELAKANKLPGSFSYGHLSFHPLWDPLRGNRRFKELVTKLGASAE
jgi:serine/threonine protein kinase/tetratricopeptide (TPR) repeat protein